MNIINSATRKLLTAQHVKSLCGSTHIRTLFSKEELGIVKFQAIQDKMVQWFKSDAELAEHKRILKERFSELPLAEKQKLLKDFIFIIDGRVDDLATIKPLLLQYDSEFNNSVHRLPSFHFGAQIMRLCYVFNRPDEAMKFYDDPELKDTFDQPGTYKILLDLLYENKQYDEVFSYYNDIRRRLELFESKPDIFLNVFIFGACYHLNTPEHYTFAKNLWKTLDVGGERKQLQKSRNFVAGLALKQNDPEFALNIQPAKGDYVAIRFIKLLAYAQTSNFREAFKVLRKTIDMVLPSRQKPTIGSKILEQLKNSIDKTGTPEEQKGFQRFYDELETQGLISNETLDDVLCTPFPPMLPKNLFQKLKKQHQ